MVRKSLSNLLSLKTIHPSCLSLKLIPLPLELTPILIPTQLQPNAQALANRLATGIAAPEAYLEYVRLNQRLRAAENAGRTAVDLVPVGLVGSGIAPPAAAITGAAGTAAGTGTGANTVGTAGNVAAGNVAVGNEATPPTAPTAAVTTPTAANISNTAPAPASAPIISADERVRPVAIAKATLTQPSRGTRRRRGTPDSDSEDNDAESHPPQRRRVSVISRISRRVGIIGRDDGHRSHSGREVEEHAESLAPATIQRGIGDTRADVPRDAGVVNTAGSSAGSANDAENADNVNVEDYETEVAPSIRGTSQAMSEVRETLRNIPRARASIAPSIAPSIASNNKADDKDADDKNTLSAPPSSGTRARRRATSTLENEITARYPQRIGSEIDATPFRPIRRSSLLNPGGRMADQTSTPFVARRAAGSSAAGSSAASTSGVGSGVGPGTDGPGDHNNEDRVTPANVNLGNDGAGDIGNVDPVTPANVDLVSEDESEDESDGGSDGDSDGEAEEKQEEEEEELQIETESIPALPPKFIIHATRGA